MEQEAVCPNLSYYPGTFLQGPKKFTRTSNRIVGSRPKFEVGTSANTMFYPPNRTIRCKQVLFHSTPIIPSVSDKFKIPDQ
jgi:hypothetical protein